MQTQKRTTLFKDLSLAEKKQFFREELFDGHNYMKKYILLMTLVITVCEATKLQFATKIENDSSRLYERILIPGLITLGVILCGVAHLKPFLAKDSKLGTLRFILLCLANISFFVGIFLNVRGFLLNVVQKNDPRVWYTGIYYVSKGIYIALLGTMVNPIWQLKMTASVAYFTALFVSYLESGLPDVGLAYAELFTSIFYVAILLASTEYFRWKLFIKRSEQDDWNIIHECILNRVHNAIVVVDPEKKIAYSNREFKTLAKNDPEGLFKKITKLKKRFDDNYDYEASLCQSLFPKDETFDEMKLNFLASTKNSRTILGKIPTGEIPDINELIEIAFQCISDCLLVDGAYFTFDGKYIDEDEKQQRSFEVTLSPMGTCKKVIVILHDNTHHARLVALETNNQYKDKLLASVSHELRTPLNGNLTLMETAISLDEVPSTVKDQFLIPAYRSGKLLDHIINDILDYSQINVGRLRMVYEELSIQKTLENCIQLMEIQAKTKGLQLLLSIDKNIPAFLTTDHNRVRQIVLNLLSNAIKFTFKGQVIVRAQVTEQNQVQISVNDTGIGIKEENIKKLFQEFAKIEEKEEMNLNSKGVGLGLMIANELVRRLTADEEQGIQVQSEYGKGSCFSFTLECKASESTHRGIESILKDSSYEGSVYFDGVDEYDFCSPKTRKKLFTRSRPPSFTSTSNNLQQFMKSSVQRLLPKSTPNFEEIQETILVVDDDPFNILALRSVLKDTGFKVDSAFNGKEAVEKVIESNQAQSPTKYKIIFMDCQMPIMDGYEATTKLCELMKDNINSIPIVGCTAFTNKGKMDDCIKCGMKDVMNKPVSKKKVQDFLEKYVKN